MVAVTALMASFGFFFFRDNFSTHYPIKVISSRSFRSGEIPYWNFHDGGGQPLAGNPNTLTFYPDNFLYLILPPHVAFNLHFILHLFGAWFAMRALARSPAAAWLYVLSGVAISATAFYNLIVAVAAIPFAFWAAERRRVLLLGAAFGLLGLAGEPVIIVAAAIGVAILWPSWRLLIAAAISAVITLPQMFAYAEIAGEVERARGFSAQTVLNTSVAPKRLLEMLVGPWFHVTEAHLFLSLFIGIVIIPALLQRSRYLLLAAIAIFFALGRFNPVIAAVVERLPQVRVVRFPEKFAIPLTVALVVLAAGPLRKRLWRIVTFVPLVAVAALTIPIDLFAPYRVAPVRPLRIFLSRSPGGQEPSRADYRERARRLEPLFGAVAGLRYAVDRSPDGMFSVMTRIATERLETTRNARYLRIAGCANAPGALPQVMFVPEIKGSATIPDTVQAMESPQFVEHTVAIGPMRLNGFRSPAEARLITALEHPQSLEIRVSTPGPAVLLVNQAYFRAWDAGGLDTFALDLDRLGIMVPAGERTITLRFGRHRTAVAATWCISLLVLLAAALALRIEVLDRGTGEVERAADEDRLVA